MTNTKATAANPFKSSLGLRRSSEARRYAATDKSDPHTYNRAMSHTTSGIVGPRTDRIGNRNVTQDCPYDADTFAGVREPDPRWAPIAHLGTIKQVPCTVFRNVVRP